MEHCCSYLASPNQLRVPHETLIFPIHKPSANIREIEYNIACRLIRCVMTMTRGYQQLVRWITVLLVAGMLPLSCIVHCHVTAPTPQTTSAFFVCHPFTTIDNDSPHHLHANTVALRATHEVAIPLALILMIMTLRSTLSWMQRTHTHWYPLPNTPPPR
jgi:hypothetical protein